jgi:hypothetical protein
VVAFALGGSGLVYLADQDVDEQFELYARTGLAAPVQISAEPATPFGDVQADLRVTPDGRFAFYRADGAVDEAFDLFRAPLDGTSPPVRFNAALTGGQDVVEFQLGPDGERVVYRSNQPASARFELHSRPVDASSASVWISGSNGNVFDFVISPTSDRVAFRAGGDYQVFLVPLDGSALPVPVPFNNPFLRSHVAYAFSSNGRRLLALDLGDQALRMLDVRAPEQVKILDAGPLPAEGAIFVPGRSQVFFLAAHDTPGAVELFACPYGKVVGASRGQ